MGPAGACGSAACACPTVRFSQVTVITECSLHAAHEVNTSTRIALGGGVRKHLRNVLKSTLSKQRMHAAPAGGRQALRSVPDEISCTPDCKQEIMLRINHVSRICPAGEKQKRITLHPSDSEFGERVGGTGRGGRVKLEDW